MDVEDQASQEEAVVVSCADDDQSDDSNAEDDIGNEMTLCGEDDNQEEVLYYNEHMDEDDEEWVYRHLRGGTTSTSDHDSAEHRNKRSSDATLSCPCCFTTVCMDCQQHVKYKNQYRAMFVMNIEVQWEKTYIYDDEEQKLITPPPPPPATSSNPQQENLEQDLSITKVEDETFYYNINSANTESKDLHYSVHCNQCKAQVAALCMYDEVYYFFDCIATFA